MPSPVLLVTREKLFSPEYPTDYFRFFWQNFRKFLLQPSNTPAPKNPICGYRNTYTYTYYLHNTIHMMKYKYDDWYVDMRQISNDLSNLGCANSVAPKTRKYYFMYLFSSPLCGALSYLTYLCANIYLSSIYHKRTGDNFDFSKKIRTTIRTNENRAFRSRIFMKKFHKN